MRRAALKVLAAMVKGLPDKLHAIYSKFAAPLIGRFQEIVNMLQVRLNNVQFLQFSEQLHISLCALFFTNIWDEFFECLLERCLQISFLGHAESLDE